MTAPTILPQKDETLYEYWASFSPLAPWLGVNWRFAFMFKTDSAAGEAAAKATKRAIKHAAKTTRETGKIAGESAAKAIEAAAETTAITSDAVAETAAGTQETMTKAATDAVEILAKPANLLPAAPAKPDDLKLIRGVGPKLEREMNDLGIYTFRQIAAFTEADLEWADANLSTIKGRPMRDDWVGQAKTLMK